MTPYNFVLAHPECEEYDEAERCVKLWCNVAFQCVHDLKELHRVESPSHSTCPYERDMVNIKNFLEVVLPELLEAVGSSWSVPFVLLSQFGNDQFVIDLLKNLGYTQEEIRCDMPHNAATPDSTPVFNAKFMDPDYYKYLYMRARKQAYSRIKASGLRKRMAISEAES